MSTATWASFVLSPVAAALALWPGIGTPVRRLAAVALGSWLLMFACLLYTSVRWS